MILPYVRGDFTGTLDGATRPKRSRAGIGDVKLRLAMNFIGTPALTPAEFMKRRTDDDARRESHGLLADGRVLRRQADQRGDEPLGDQAGDRRFSADRAMVSRGLRRRVDLRRQRQLLRRASSRTGSLGEHSGSTWPTFFARACGLRVDGTYYDGGRSTIDGVKKDDRQTNSRASA